ncbi:MAG: cob(I)yrinic acid a,c-diamide adenosyltransferase [Syntrophobacteraceae bacterium]|nr:cob(I)yrinic acid a,c-diamide adenosyltransferase [Syntrophobacteraceae bacterium]
MKAYTGRGDLGITSLYSGERVAKTHPRVEACGDIDELNSVLGAVISTFPAEKSDLKAEAEHIQSVLFVAGAFLSTTPDSQESGSVDSVAEAETEFLERAIDRMEGELPRLKEFVLPGGHFSAALAHIARTVCRRAERHVVALAPQPCEGKAYGELTSLIMFLNRLSSYLFVAARSLNRLHGVQEAQWKRPGQDYLSPG